MQVRGYSQFGGKHHETAALRNVLAHWGVTAPHTRQPFSEALLFGIAGGIAASHSVFSIARQPYFVPIWRNMGQFAKTVAEKLKLTTHIIETSSAKLAETNLRELLDGGDPVMAWGDMASVPYHALPADLVRYFRHVFVIYGYDDLAGTVMVADRACVPLTLTFAELATIRGAIGFRRRLMIVEPPDEIEGLAQAVLDGIRNVCQSMTDGKGMRNGLRGLDMWAKQLERKKNKQDWAQVFNTPALLFDALCSVYYFGEIRGTGGGAYRQMYADFLDEAVVITNKPGLHDAAELYREAAALWTALAEAALPDDVPPYGEARELIKRRTMLYEQQGQVAQAEMNAITDQLWTMRAQLDATSQPEQATRDTLLTNLHDHVLRVRAAEVEAAGLLQLLVGW